MPDTLSPFPDLGFGLGLRIPHYAHILAHTPQVDWFEIISENFMDTDGRAKRNLARIRDHYPIAMHGVALSIGTVDPLDSEYLRKLKGLIDFASPAWISDHLCWTGVAHRNLHDLLPVPYTEEALRHIVARIKQVQDYLGRPIALENPSTYLEFKHSTIPEAEFIAAMARESGCHLLLDVNNVYVTCYNHRLDAKAYIDALPLDKVAQIHLSGHRNYGTHIIDTHDDHVVDEVWALYKYVIHTAGRTINTMVEWDDNVPQWDVLYAELDKAKAAAADAPHYAPLPELAGARARRVNGIAEPLDESQLRMQEAILVGAKIDSKPDTWIHAKKQFAPAEQLAVYVNAYRYRLHEATVDDYPVLKHFLGDDAFEGLITDFVNSVESAHFNIGRYAAHLPGYLARHSSGDPFACELATLEKSVSQLLDPQETIALEPAHLEGMTPDDLLQCVLRPRTALRLLAFDFPVNDYFLAVQEGQFPPPPTPERTFVAVFRHEDVVWRMALGENEYLLLEKLFDGTPVGAALDELQAELELPEDELGSQLAHWFSRWMRNGLLAWREYTREPCTRNIA
ncbi:MAG: DUF692 family protein [Gammaproteobacteria bacterium]|jgi:uncharacterized protein (UPF0276 family)|nr:DUF692 family protein [Gammaproteobacteria bacterium]MBK7521683.1 DUF692 family protein [Gammaproteobacteria bacterium]MBK7729457.1 DUF692 family protein [Gammaproteobacteria bacterium]